MSALNGTMMQFFHWYLPADGSLWDEAATRAEELAAAGFTALWLPPAYKGASGGLDVGYGAYDLFDLGEFAQKGSVRTKYGTRAQYLAAIQALQGQGLQVYADAVLNHKMKGDGIEEPWATPFWQDNRTQPAGPRQQIKTYTHFHFPGRAHTHSDFEWHWQHFDAVDYNQLNPDSQNLIYLLDGKQFDDQVALDYGNYAYLMGCDLDFQNPEVRAEINAWGRWYLDQTGVDGFRLDAIKHIAAWFFPQWLDMLEGHVGRDLFAVGEYWSPRLETLHWYLDALGGRMAVFDVPLHYHFHAAGQLGSAYDLRYILDGTLMQSRPTLAVTFVDNHDSQPLQALESTVVPWFKPLAYALILLRAEGYPCVFYPDYYGATYVDHDQTITLPSHRWLIDKFLQVRRQAAFGPQYDYFDHPNVVGWTRLGDEAHPHSCAVLLSNGADGYKWMEVGKPRQTCRDLTEHIPYPVTSNEWGWARFECRAGSVSVWIEAS